MTARASILTGWSEIGPRRFRPAVVDDHHLSDWTDVTGQPFENLIPAPNLCVVEALVDEATLDAIEADNRYFVLESEEVIDG